MKETMWISHLLGIHLSCDYSVQLPALSTVFTIPWQVHVFCLNHLNLLGKAKAKQPFLPHLSQLQSKGQVIQPITSAK